MESEANKVPLEAGARTDAEVRERLGAFVNERYGSWSRFVASTQIPQATASDWKLAGKSFPGMKHLLRMSRDGLSLDWLVTGKGPMLARLGETREGAVAEMLRPALARKAGVGSETADQAFHQLVTRYGVDGILDVAAEALLPTFRDSVERLHALHTYIQLLSRADSDLAELRDKIAAGSPNERSQAIDAFRKSLLETLPPDFRPGTPLSASLFAALRNSISRSAKSEVDEDSN